MANDRLIKNGRVVDGSGGPSFHGDLAVHHGRIVGVGQFNATARRVINDEGQCRFPAGHLRVALDSPGAFPPTGHPAIYNLASQELEHPDGWKEPLHWLEESFKSDRWGRARGFFNRRWDLVQVFMTASGW